MIYGTRTRLRRIERTDIPTFVRWFNDPEVRQFLMLNRPISRDQEEEWYERQLKDKNSEIFAIEIAQGDEVGTHIGNIGLHNLDGVNRSAELGIVIGEKAYWNQGYGSDAIRALLGFGFYSLNLHRIFLRVHADNARGIRAYEKCGFQHEGRLREAVFKNGRYYDEVRMAILSDEFEHAQIVSNTRL